MSYNYKPRKCLRCGEEYKPASGNQKYCPGCQRAAWREKQRVSSRRYEESHREWRREYDRRWRLAHREQIRVKDKIRRIKKYMQERAAVV